MKRYDSYKDSGVEWIGKIPSHWDSASLLYLLRAKISDGPHETPNLIEDGIPFISIDSLNDTKEIDFSVVKKFISYKDYERYCYKTKLEKGDVLFSKAATIGKTAIVGDCVFMVWSPLAILKPNLDKISSLYLYYIMNCKKAIEEVSLSGSKNTQINVGMRELEKIRIPIPSIEEQSKITYFLEKETSKIDEAIAQQQKMIDLLNERKQIIINNAVTKGLDPNIPLKDSGIEWLGKIPSHWKTIRLGYCSWIRARLGWKGLKANEYVDNGYAFLSAFNIQNNQLVWEPLNFITKYRYDESPEIKLKVGDILLVKDGAGIGKCARVDSMPMGEATANGSLAFISPDEKMHYRFLYFFIISNSFRKYTELLINGMGVPHFTQGEMKKVKVPLPPIDEQVAISEFLDLKIDKINNAISHYQDQISLLQERKQIIINDVVTGKVKVV